MDVLVTRDAAVACLDPSHVPFQIIIGAWQVFDIIASKQPPPAAAKGLVNVTIFLRNGRAFLIVHAIRGGF
jgi:hypothetical protein